MALFLLEKWLTFILEKWLTFERKFQQSRDKLKDDILTKYGLKPYRISTVDTINVETIEDILLNNIK